MKKNQCFLLNDLQLIFLCEAFFMPQHHLNWICGEHTHTEKFLNQFQNQLNRTTSKRKERRQSRLIKKINKAWLELVSFSPHSNHFLVEQFVRVLRRGSIIEIANEFNFWNFVMHKMKPLQAFFWNESGRKTRN